MSQVAKTRILRFVSFIRSSQIVFDPAVDAIKSYPDILDGVGERKSQITFALPAVCRTGKARHASFVQQCVGEFARALSGLSDIREGVKSAPGFLAAKSANAI